MLLNPMPCSFINERAACAALLKTSAPHFLFFLPLVKLLGSLVFFVSQNSSATVIDAQTLIVHQHSGGEF